MGCTQRRTRRATRRPSAPRCAYDTDGFVNAEGFETTDGLYGCDPTYVVHLEGDYGKGTTLADVGKSLDDLE